jgi:hypothetical protein
MIYDDIGDFPGKVIGYLARHSGGNYAALALSAWLAYYFGLSCRGVLIVLALGDFALLIRGTFLCINPLGHWADLRDRGRITLCTAMAVWVLYPTFGWWQIYLRQYHLNEAMDINYLICLSIGSTVALCLCTLFFHRANMLRAEKYPPVLQLQLRHYLTR